MAENFIPARKKLSHPDVRERLLIDLNHVYGLRACLYDLEMDDERDALSPLLEDLKRCTGVQEMLDDKEQCV